MEEESRSTCRRFVDWITKRARKRGVGFWASFGVALLTLVLLAHTEGIGYELGRCGIPEFREVAFNWIFWWSFHAFGLGSYCGVWWGAIPFYIVSVIWWALLSFVIARIAMYVFPKLRGIE